MSIQARTPESEPTSLPTIEQSAVLAASSIMFNYAEYLSGARPDFSVYLIYPTVDETSGSMDEASRMQELLLQDIMAKLDLRETGEPGEMLTRHGIRLYARIHAAQYDRELPVGVEYSTQPFVVET